MITDSFKYDGHRLSCEGVDAAALLKQYGSPLYVYSAAGLRALARNIRSGLENIPVDFRFAVKANSNAAVIRTLADEGFGADVVSAGELKHCLKAGVDPSRIIFAGVGKQTWELRDALESRVGLISVESEWEIEQLAQLFRAQPQAATRCLVRCNPDLDGRTHPYLTTGKDENKFGIPAATVSDRYRDWAGALRGRLVGIQVHVGSQIMDMAVFSAAADFAAAFVADLRNRGCAIELVDFGGGVGVRYESNEPVDWNAYKTIVRNLHQQVGVPLILEPGRSVVAESGVCLSTVIQLKRGRTKDFLIVDIAMNDLIRPALYQAHHEIWPLFVGPRDKGERLVDVVGPICESGDFLGKNRTLPALEPGDSIAILTTGAYGFVMASNYNDRPKPAEVMVDGDRSVLIRARESE